MLRCQVCRREVTAATWEGVFVNPAFLLAGIPLRMAVDVSSRHAPLGWLIWILVAALLPFVIGGALFYLCWCLLKAAVYVVSFLWQCPACGSRRWAWPRSEPLAFP
jgi:hypothetical protein